LHLVILPRGRVKAPWYNAGDMNAPYTAYAPFYDGSGQIRFAVLVGQYVAELLARHPAPGHRALDLACGSGTLAVMLADDGWDVTGVDRSLAMLALAETKASTLLTAGTVRLGAADLRALPFTDQEGTAAFALTPGAYHLATCTYDSINYLLSEAELLACFNGVARALGPGGLFLFDVNTELFLRAVWPPCELDERPGFVQVQISEYTPETMRSTMRLIGFVGDDTHGYTRFEELHTARAYPNETIVRLLARAGMRTEALYDCFTFQEPGAASQRVMVVARLDTAAAG
jgi:SAM-dependent methyltransferase